MNNNYKEFIWPKFANHIREIYDEHIEPYAQDIYKDSVRVVQVNSSFELVRLCTQFKFLGDHMLILIQPKNTSSPVHIDNKPGTRGREFGFNVGIKGMTKDGRTEFYKTNQDQFDILEGDSDSSRGSTIFKKADCTKIDEYCLLDQAVLINTTVPHQVNHMHGTETRVSLSWSINPDLTWEQTIEMIESANQKDV